MVAQTESFVSLLLSHIREITIRSYPVIVAVTLTDIFEYRSVVYVNETQFPTDPPDRLRARGDSIARGQTAPGESRSLSI